MLVRTDEARILNNTQLALIKAKMRLMMDPQIRFEPEKVIENVFCSIIDELEHARGRSR